MQLVKEGGAQEGVPSSAASLAWERHAHCSSAARRPAGAVWSCGLWCRQLPGCWSSPGGSLADRRGEVLRIHRERGHSRETDRVSQVLVGQRWEGWSGGCRRAHCWEHGGKSRAVKLLLTSWRGAIPLDSASCVLCSELSVCVTSVNTESSPSDKLHF